MTVKMVTTRLEGGFDYEVLVDEVQVWHKFVSNKPALTSQKRRAITAREQEERAYKDGKVIASTWKMESFASNANLGGR